MASGKSFKGFQPNTLSGRESYFSSQNSGENKQEKLIENPENNQEKIEPFLKVYEWMTRDLDLDACEALILAVIMGFQASGLNCTVSHRYFEQICNCKRSKVKTALNLLQERQYIEWHQITDGSTNQYVYRKEYVEKCIQEKRGELKNDSIVLEPEDCPW